MMIPNPGSIFDLELIDSRFFDFIVNCYAHSASPERPLGALGSLQDPTWGSKESLEGLLGVIWALQGASKEAPRIHLVPPSTYLGPPRSTWEPSGPTWKPPRVTQGASRGCQGGSRECQGVPEGSILSRFWHRFWVQNR